MKLKKLAILLLILSLAFACTEESKTTQTAASQNTGSNSTDESNPPKEDSNIPIEDSNKPVEDTNKPVDDTNKPVEDTNKPVEDTNKPAEDTNKPSDEQAEQTKTMINAKVDDTIIKIQWENNDAVKKLHELLSKNTITVKMSQYGGFEQVGPLGHTLPRHDAQTTTGPGDVILYLGNQIVIYYGTNSWSFTRLGKIIDKTDAEIKALLDKPNVTLYLSSAADDTKTP